MQIRKIVFTALCMLMFFTIESNAFFALSELEDTSNSMTSEEKINENEVYAEVVPSTYVIGTKELITIKANSGIGITGIDAKLYNYNTGEEIYSKVYEDASAMNKEVILNLRAPNVPVEKLALICDVKNKRTSRQLVKLYAMTMSSLGITYNSSNAVQVKDSNYIVTVKSSIDSVPLAELTYTFKDQKDKVIRSGEYRLNNKGYTVDTNSGEIIYDKAYTVGALENAIIPTNSRSSIKITEKLDMPSNQKIKFEVKAKDVEGKSLSSSKTFTLVDLAQKITITPTSEKKINIGENITVKAIATNKSTGETLQKGLKDLVVRLYDGSEVVKTSQKTDTTVDGKGELSLALTLPPIKNELYVEVLSTDINGRVETLKQKFSNVNKNIDSLEPTFTINNSRKVAGTSESVTAKSAADIRLTEAVVKLVDKNGNVITNNKGKPAKYTSSSAGSTALYPYVSFPSTYMEDVYFICSAKAGDIVYEDTRPFEEMSSRYKKGPYTIYLNKIKISADKTSGLINRNSEININVSCTNTDFKIKNVKYMWESTRDDAKVNFQICGAVKVNGIQKCKYCIDSTYAYGGIANAFTNSKEGTVDVQIDGNVLKVTPKDIPTGYEKEGYGIVWRPARTVNNAWRIEGYYIKGPGKVQTAYYDMETEYKIEKTVEKEINAVADTIRVDIPDVLSNKMILKIVAIDERGDSDTIKYEYSVDTYTMKTVPSILPSIGKVTSGMAITANADLSDDTVRLKYASYEIFDSFEKYKEEARELDYESEGKIFSFVMPDVKSEREVTLRFTLIDENGRIFKNDYKYKVIPKVTNPDYSKFISATFLGGKIEYVLEYYTQNGTLITAVLDEYNGSTFDFYNYNVKNMQISRFTDFNNKLIAKGYPRMPAIENFHALYTKLTLDYSLTYMSLDGTNYASENKELVLFSKSEKVVKEQDGEEVIEYNKVSSEGFGILTVGNVADNLVGENAKVSSLFDTNEIRMILEKVQSQLIKAINFDDLDDFTEVLDPVYNPPFLTNGIMPKAAGSGTVSFNESYIRNKEWLNAQDMVTGLAINVDPSPFNNEIHYVYKYYVTDYTYTEEYRPNTHVHTSACGPIVKDVYGNEYYSNCNEPEKVLWTIYKVLCNGVEDKTNEYEEIKMTQTAIPFTEYGYRNASGENIFVGQGNNFSTDKDGKLTLVAKTTWKPKSFDEMFKSRADYVEGREAYDVDTNFPTDKEITEFTAMAVMNDVKIDMAAPVVKLQSNQYLYKNSANNNYYERSSDRGNTLLFKIDDSQDTNDDNDDLEDNTSGVKKVTAKWKYSGFTKESVIQFTDGKVTQNNVQINIPLEAMKIGGLIELTVIAEDNAGNVSDGKIYYNNESIDLKLFINTSKALNPLPNGKSLIVGAGLTGAGNINTTVASNIGEGKTIPSVESTALKILEVADVKWQHNKISTDGCNTGSMALYMKNLINDTIGLGYRVDFSMDTIGYGMQSEIGKSDAMILKVLFYGKYGNALKEIEPYMKDKDGNYVLIPENDSYRTLKMLASNVEKETSKGLSGLKKDILGNVTWNFSYYLPNTIKFKLKGANANDPYLTLNEVAVAFDIELIKWYGLDGTSTIANGTDRDSRHLYTLREDKWAASTNGNITPKGDISIKSENINIRNIDTTKGIVFWYDIVKDASFDLKGQKY